MLKNKQPAAVSIRATMQQQHLASARNRRLAQQMENRPSVQAALNQKQVRAPPSGWSRVPAGLGGCGPSLIFLLHHPTPESEAAPGEGQHPGPPGPAPASHDAWGCWWRERTARDEQRGPPWASQRRSDEGSPVPQRSVLPPCSRPPAALCA